MGLAAIAPFLIFTSGSVVLASLLFCLAVCSAAPDTTRNPTDVLPLAQQVSRIAAAPGGAGVPERAAHSGPVGDPGPVRIPNAAPLPGASVRAPADDGGSPVPEPTTLLLVGGGLVGLAVSSRRWRKTLGSGTT